MSKVHATIVLHYGEGVPQDSSSCTVEHDEVLDTIVDSDGKVVEKTSFAPGDIYHFLTKCAEGIYISKILATAGDITYLGSVTRTRENETNSIDNKPSVSYLSSGSLTPVWYGNVGGPLYVDNTELKVDIRTGTIPCYCKATYPVAFYSYRLTPQVLPYDSYTVYIAIYLEKS